jgi:hypothetical protein
MDCPFRSGVPPLFEQSAETPHTIQTNFWYEAADFAAHPEGVALHDFNGILGTLLAVTFQEKKKGGAVLTAHYCLTEGDTIFTQKSRVPLDERERAALFGFMKDLLRHTETRGRKRKHTIDDIRAALRRTPKASISRLALDLGVTRETVRHIIKAGGKTLSQLQRETREARDTT